MLSADLPDPDRIFVFILYGCGLRRGETLALTKNSIDLKKRTLTVTQSVAFETINEQIQKNAQKYPFP